jgi:protein involved in polysaccharide export with SLBB domain
VTVEFEERAQITVGFTGMLNKPGSLKLPRGKRLLDGLALAEGVKIDADLQKVRFQRRDDPAPKILDLSRVLESDATLNLELRDGDSVYVPPLPTYTIQVLGAVNKPDLLVRKEKIRLLDAVLAASGFTEDANRKAVELLRRGTTVPEIFNLEGVLSGKDANPLLGDGDTVTVPAFRRISVKVFGSVAKPGQLLVREGTTVQAAITDAGGFNPDANRAAVTVKSVGGEARAFNLVDVNSPDARFALPEGAEVLVPQLDRFAVTGGVAKPDVFPLPADGKSKVYLSDALGLAGGPIDRAKKKKVYIIHKDPATGAPVVQEVNYAAYLTKKDPRFNPEIRANDVVFIDAEPDRGEKRSILDHVAPFLRVLTFGI